MVTNRQSRLTIFAYILFGISLLSSFYKYNCNETRQYGAPVDLEEVTYVEITAFNFQERALIPYR